LGGSKGRHIAGSNKQGAEFGIGSLLLAYQSSFLSWQHSCTVARANAGFYKVAVVMAKIA
jgi:hypothetical protein